MFFLVDGLLYLLGSLAFLGVVTLAWLSTHVNQIHLPNSFLLAEQQIYQNIDDDDEEESEQTSPAPSSTRTSPREHESDMELSEHDEPLSEQTPQDQSLRITIKFLNETQKSISANANDTISKIKRLYFADELSNDKIIRFIYQGRELQDSQTLRTSNIHDQTTIHCQISTPRHPTPIRMNTDGVSSAHLHANEFDTSSFLDTSPINLSLQLILFLTFVLGSLWYLRVKYRLLFTPISTIMLILITIIFLIFTCGPLLSTSSRQPSSNTVQD